MKKVRVPLGDICSLITDGKHGDCKNEINSGYYFISAKDIFNEKIHYGNAREIIYDDFAETHRRTNFSIGDIACTNSGTIGRLAIARDNIRTTKTTFQKSVAVLKPISSKVISEFLYYALKNNNDLLNNSARGTAQKNLLLGDLKALTIEMFSLDYQERIINILSTYDDLIENNLRRIELLEQSARHLYEEWFVRFRFPGAEHVKMVHGVPEGWRSVPIKDFGEIITGKTPSTKESDNFGGSIPFIKTPDMHNNVFIVSTETLLTEKGANTQINKFLPPNTLLISCIGTVGVVSISSELSQCNQQINALLLDDHLNLYFCYYSFKKLKARLEGIGGGVTMANVNKSKFETMIILRPAESVIKEFHEFCQPTFLQILSLLRQNQKLKQARDLLLPKLMSGEIAV